MGKTGYYFTRYLLLCSLVSHLLLFEQAYSQEKITVNGFLQNYNGLQTSSGNELLAGRNRVRFELSRPVSVGNIFLESDLIHRYNDGDSDVEVRLRQAYLEWFFDKSDLKIGLQNIITGKSDGGFVTDIFSPVDLREFLATELDDIRLGVVSINYIRYFRENFLQLIGAPVFQRDLIPEPDSRWFPVQPVPSPVPVNFITGTGRNTIEDVQAAVRYGFRSNLSVDLDLFGYYWTHPTPTYGLTLNLADFQNGPNITLRETYNPSPMAGYAFEWRTGKNLIVKSEALFVQQKLFNYLPVSDEALTDPLNNLPEIVQLLQVSQQSDDEFLVEKPWLQGMIGLQSEIAGTTISVQGYLETIFNFDENILQRRHFPYVTGLAQKSILRDRLNLLSLGRFNTFAEDFWIQFQGIYEAADGVELALGTNLFGGPDPPPVFGHFSFNLFRDQSFLFARFTVFL